MADRNWTARPAQIEITNTEKVAIEVIKSLERFTNRREVISFLVKRYEDDLRDMRKQQYEVMTKAYMEVLTAEAAKKSVADDKPVSGLQLKRLFMTQEEKDAARAEQELINAKRKAEKARLKQEKDKAKEIDGLDNITVPYEEYVKDHKEEIVQGFKDEDVEKVTDEDLDKLVEEGDE